MYKLNEYTMVEPRITARNMELTPAIEKYALEKIAKFDYLLDTATDIACELTESAPHRGKDSDFMIEINVTVPNARIMVRQEGADIYAMIDAATDVLSRRLKRYKDKIKQWETGAGWKAGYVEDLENSVKDLISEVEDYSDYVPSISKKIKLTEMPPMHEAEAIERMELMGFDSYLFKNSETGSWCLVRKNKGEYELIET